MIIPPEITTEMVVEFWNLVFELYYMNHSYFVL